MNNKKLSSEERANLMARAETYWSEEEHFDQMMEECLELTLSIFHMNRKKCDMDEVIRELADVDIMLDRFKTYFMETGIDFQHFKDEKLLKMEETMDDGRK